MSGCEGAGGCEWDCFTLFVYIYICICLRKYITVALCSMIIPSSIHCYNLKNRALFVRHCAWRKNFCSEKEEQVE